MGEAAQSLGWHPEKLYRLERGAQVPDALELAALAAAFEQPLDYFLGSTSYSPHAGDSGADGARVLKHSGAVVKAANA